MDSFCLKIAGCVGEIWPLFESTRLYFRGYLTEEPPDFVYGTAPEHLLLEQEMLRREAEETGMKHRIFSDPFLERAAIQRRFAEQLLPRDTLLLHGSAVAVDGQGYLFTAKCGTGKSTHTRFWRSVFGDRSVMVNDDKPFLRLTAEGALVCGSPWSGKHGLDTNVEVPLKGVCVLERGKENRIVPMACREALPLLREQCYVSLTETGRSLVDTLVSRLCQSVPLWYMDCTRDPEAAQIAYRAMSGGAAQH